MKDATGTTAAEMAASWESELVQELNRAARRRSLLPLVVLLALLVVTLPVALWVRSKDRARRRVVVDYEIDGEPGARYDRLLAAFEAVQGCAGCWEVRAEGAVRTTWQWKTHAGADNVVDRAPVRASFGGPPALAANIRVPGLHGPQRSVYFLPDRILVHEGQGYADLAYAECKVSWVRAHTTEDGSLPNDAVRVGSTWTYLNKGGGPDRRYRDNPQLPVMDYGEVVVTGQTGLQATWLFSQPEAAKGLSAALLVMGRESGKPKEVGSAARRIPHS